MIPVSEKGLQAHHSQRIETETEMSFLFGSKKPKEPETSGFMGDTSPEQDAVAAQFKEWIIATGIADLEKLHFDDHDILRFCRARKFVLADIQLMFSNFVEWRQREQVDTIMTDFHFTEHEAVFQVHPMFYHGVDKLGRPVFCDLLGRVNVDDLFSVTTEERLMRHHIQDYETTMKLRFPSCSALAGKHISQSLSIVNLNGGTVAIANKQTFGMTKIAAQIG